MRARRWLGWVEAVGQGAAAEVEGGGYCLHDCGQGAVDRSHVACAQKRINDDGGIGDKLPQAFVASVLLRPHRMAHSHQGIIRVFALPDVGDGIDASFLQASAGDKAVAAVVAGADQQRTGPEKGRVRAPLRPGRRQRQPSSDRR